MKKIYIVKWIDSYSNSRWYNDKEIKNWSKETEEDMIISIGFLHKKTKKFILLYADKGLEKARFIKIPTGCIKSIKKLKVCQ